MKEVDCRTEENTKDRNWEIKFGFYLKKNIIYFIKRKKKTNWKIEI